MSGHLHAVGSEAVQLGVVTEPPIIAPVPRLALNRQEAAAALGMSLTSFEAHVQPTLRLVRLGRMRLVPVAELEHWLADRAETALSR